MLFTDLVGSTALATRLDPDDADRVRQEHFALLRGAVAEYQGEEVKNLGDGLMVVFPLASTALACAEAMQQAVARGNERSPEPMAIRVGIAHGEATEEDGDYFGDAVIEAARLCAACEADQILATQAVQLAAGRRAKQPLVSVGELELKGLPDPVATVEVQWARPSSSAGGAAAIPLPRRCAVAPDAGFVGRVPEREQLALAHKASQVESELRVVLLSGEAGIGKTTLSLEFARAAHSQGGIVLYGRADEELAVPYGPWAEAIAHLVTHASPSLLEALQPHGPSLVRLAPSLAPLLGPAPEAAADAETARFVLYGAVASALQAAASVAPVVVLLDDLHWADAPTLQLLRSLVRSPVAMPVLVVGTFRDADVAAGSPMADLLGAFHREPNVARVALRGLDDVELLALMEAAAGQAMDEDGLALRDALAAETDGNPFFVGELLRHLTESGALYQEEGRWVAGSDLRDSGLPVSVLEVVGRRVNRLGDDGGKVLGIASVIGRDFSLSVLAAVSELDEDRLLDVLDAAVEASLVENLDGDRYTFVHALIEHTLYESLAPARRARLHRRVAEAIEDAAGSGADQAAALAHHWGRASVPGDVDKALGYAMAAGDEALARLAPDEARRWYGTVASLLDQRSASDDALRCRLLVGTGDAQRQVGDPAYRDTLLEAAHLAQRIGDDELLVAAALANSRGFVSNAGTVDDARIEVLQAAVRAVEGTGSAAEARLLAALARELVYNRDLEARAAIGDQALSVARAVGDHRTLAAVINGVVEAVQVPSTLARRIELTAEAWELTAELDDPHLRFWAALQRSNFLLEAGQVAEADEALGVARSVAERVGQPLLRWVSTFTDGCRTMLAGDLDRSEQHCTAAAELATATDQPDALTFLGAQLSTIRIMQGRADEVVALVQAVREHNPGVPSFDAAYALMLVEEQRLDEAREVLGPVAESGFAFPDDLAYLGGMGQAAAVVVELGWTDAAAVLYRELLPYEEQLYYVGLTCGPEMSVWLGALATVLGRFDDAERHLARARATHEHIGAAWALVLTEIYTGRFLLARNAPRDREQAVELLRSSRVDAEQRGYAGLVRRVDRILDQTGIDP